MSDTLGIDKKELETIDVETPIEEVPPITTPPEEPNIPHQKKSKKKVVVVISIIVLLLLAVGFVVYWLFFKEQPATITQSGGETVSQTETPTQDTRDYAKELMDKIRASEASLVNQYPNSKVEDSEPFAPAYMYGPNMYYVSGNFGYSIFVTDDGTYNEAFAKAGEDAAYAVLDKEELIRKDTEMLTTFIDDNVICSVSRQSSPVYISCANTRDYKTPSENIQPYAKAYFANPNAADESQIVFGQPRVKDTSDGYQNATVSIGSYQGVGGFAGLFYGKNGNWTYWTGTQSTIPCSNYNTYELQKSFEGTTCYVEGQGEDSVVIVTLNK